MYYHILGELSFLIRSHKWNYWTCHNRRRHLSVWMRFSHTLDFQDGSLKIYIQLSWKFTNKMFWWEPDDQLDGPRVGEKDYSNQCNNKQHLMQHAHKGEKARKQQMTLTEEKFGKFLLSFLIVCWLWGMTLPPLSGLIFFSKTPRTLPLICLK